MSSRIAELEKALVALRADHDALKARVERLETGALAEVEQLRHRLETSPPWEVSTNPTNAELEALRRRWSTGPEQYQADADALIAAVLYARAENARLTTERDAAALGAFRAGLDAAATFHEQRAAFTAARIDHARANPSLMPDDVRDELIEEWSLEASQERADARMIRDIPAPASLPVAAVEADARLRAQHTEHLAEMQERLNKRSVRCETLTREVERLRAQLAAAQPALELEALRAGRFSAGKVAPCVHLCKADEPGGCTVCDPTIARPTRDDAPAADLTGFFEGGALLEVDDAPCKCSSCAEEQARKERGA